jgi:hypothetical protein
MFGDDQENESFEDMLRSIARELGDSVERAIEGVDIDDIAQSFGVDPSSARGWIDSAGGWLRAQAESAGEASPLHFGSRERSGAGAGERSAGDRSHPVSEDPLRSAAPHPLDLPTDEQGMALAALESGRWMVEPGTDALAARGDGPGPSNALGIVRELRVRDWLSAEGEVTLVGRHALSRWLDAATPPKGS